MEILVQAGIMVLGFVILIKGAGWFVDGASGIASKLGIPQLVIGLTIVAMGTSMPEAAVSISSALKGSADITIGNVVGSNILNILIILGLSSVIIPIKVAGSTVRYEIPFMIVITVILPVLGYTEKSITFLEGVLLWGFLAVYFIYLFLMVKKQTVSENREAAEQPLWKLAALLVIGIIMVVLGSNFSVDGATGIAKIFGISERFIGLTIVAIGTSLPELATSVTAAKKGNADIAIGNVVGEQYF